ncbi:MULTISPECIES: N-acetylmuramoyl-L-alanine amidase family protein [Bacillus cereus group]|uniref:N-acetylmuramoyl-L-alanine amidase family protein n=1 Tax=Bacillus cereus group TaxID=86661 RepID=UPI0005CA2929|nr:MULTISPECIES: hypothetical protein [Bacillus cereus group]KIZ30170.1 hypothetical protein SK30_11745 [Bacillus cereus]MBJ8127400.1 hypothetical protein [Bacillus cereus]PGB45756.1 hypothetical protein COL95_29635 [Bacillus anthracis]
MIKAEYSIFYPDNDNRRKRVMQLSTQCKDLAKIINTKKGELNRLMDSLDPITKSYISTEIIHSYAVKDFFFTPRIVDWALEAANWIAGLVNGATQRSNYRKATNEFCKIRLKLKFMELMADYLEGLLLSISQEVNKTKIKGKLYNWTQEKLENEIKNDIKLTFTIVKRIKDKPSAIKTLVRLQELDDTLQAWINEDPSIEDLEDTMNELDALTSPTYEYQKRAGWKYSNGNAYYLEKNGNLKKGRLIEESDRKYFLTPDGTMARNMWLEADDGKKYYFGKHGAAKFGWYKEYDRWYYFGKDGAALTGWMQDKRNNRWYYFSPEFITNVCYKAQMLQNHSLMIKTYQGPYKLFNFDENGVCTNP